MRTPVEGWIVPRGTVRIWSIRFPCEDWPSVILLIEVAVVVGIVLKRVSFMWGGLVWVLIVRIVVLFGVERIIVLVVSIV